jgi:polyisoprenoid-binding protein YceI
MKYVFTSALLFLIYFNVNFSVAQKKYSSQTADLNFASKAELELIKASCKQVRGLVNPATNQFAFSADIKSFKGFNSELQREHFNEKYLESDKYPNATFSGKIIEQIDFTKNGTYDVRAKGDLDIHGQKQTRIIKVKMVVENETIKIDAQFLVPLSDHNISIPSIVSQKIATEIEVSFIAVMNLQ